MEIFAKAHLEWLVCFSSHCLICPWHNPQKPAALVDQVQVTWWIPKLYSAYLKKWIEGSLEGDTEKLRRNPVYHNIFIAYEYHMQ